MIAHTHQLKNMPERRKAIDEELKSLQKKLDNVEEEDKKLGLPHIPMGENTHTKQTDGYVYNKTKIILQKGVKEDLVTNLLQERIKAMWNSLPDDIRNSVDRLIVKRSRAMGRKWQGGRWDDRTKTITININSKTSGSLDHNFFHEVGHSRWHRLKETNPEKVKKFRETQIEIGTAPTYYSQSYSLIKVKNEEKERVYRRKMERDGLVISAKAEEILKNNRISAEDLYHNEIHSELNAYAMGSLLTRDISTSKENMVKLLNAYKEMWDLE